MVAPATLNDKLNMIRQKAERGGANAVEFLAGGFAESGPNLDQLERYGEWPDWSFGPYQQTVKFAPIGNGTSTQDNVSYVRNRFLNDWDYALDVALSQFLTYRSRERNALDAWCRYNSPNLHPFRNGNRANYARSLTRAQAVWRDVVAYNSRVDAEIQDQNWTCSASSAVTWLRSLGIQRSEAYVRDWLMFINALSEENGLEDARGYGLKRFLSEDCQQPSVILENPSWERIRAIAGTRPIMMGSSVWYHWVFVKHVTEDRTKLILGNPGSTLVGDVGTLGRYGGDELAYYHYNLYSPWHAVVYGEEGENL